MSASAFTPISKPPGARASARTSPVSATLHSCVKVPNAAQSSSDTSAFTTTPCMIPVPSRTTAKPSLPLERRCVAQARTVTVAPT